MELKYHESSESSVFPEIRSKGFLMVTHLLLRNVGTYSKYRSYNTDDRTLQNSVCPTLDLPLVCFLYERINW
jgi:hypothetical protein